jgi:uncharacterized protein (TIGR02117 family)
MRAAILLVAILAVSACSDRPFVAESHTATDAPRTYTVFVVNHGLHTGLVVSADEINLLVPGLRERFGNAVYYEIGWGDEGFYQAREISVGLAVQAMFLSHGAIIHIVALPGSPGESFPKNEIFDTCLSNEEAASLRAFVASSFAKDPSGHIVPLGRGIYGDSEFFSGTGRYSVLNTCNTWTAEGLANAGMDISPALTFTATSVMRYLREHRQDCTAAPQVGREHTQTRQLAN